MPTSIPPAELRADRLSGTVAIVTGSTHGIGLGIARRFAREGAAVVVNDAGNEVKTDEGYVTRDGAGQYDGDAVAAELRELGAEAIYVPADASDADEIEALVETTVAEFGRVDVVANNVAGWRHGPLETRDLEDWEFVVNTTMRSHWLTTHHAVEHMPDGGSVVNISSALSLATSPGMFPYDMAKAGVNGLTRALAVGLGHRNVRVNAILPGAITTGDPEDDPAELERPQIDVDETVPDRISEPVGRRGVPADVAACAAFLASDDAAFVSGVTIPVDGGRLAVFSDERYADWREGR